MLEYNQDQNKNFNSNQTPEATNVAPAPDNTVSMEQVASIKPKRKWRLIILISVVSILIIGAVAYLFLKKPVEKVVDEVVNTETVVENNDTENVVPEAYELFDSRSIAPLNQPIYGPYFSFIYPDDFKLKSFNGDMAYFNSEQNEDVLQLSVSALSGDSGSIFIKENGVYKFKVKEKLFNMELFEGKFIQDKDDFKFFYNLKQKQTMDAYEFYLIKDNYLIIGGISGKKLTNQDKAEEDVMKIVDSLKIYYQDSFVDVNKDLMIDSEVFTGSLLDKKISFHYPIQWPNQIFQVEDLPDCTGDFWTRDRGDEAESFFCPSSSVPVFTASAYSKTKADFDNFYKFKSIYCANCMVVGVGDLATEDIQNNTQCIKENKTYKNYSFETYACPENKNLFYSKEINISVVVNMANKEEASGLSDLILNSLSVETIALDLDTDSDGLSDVDELKYSTNPQLADTDGDGYLDGDEVKNGYNPLGGGKL